MDTTTHTLRYDRLPDGTLVAILRGVAAIVHPAATSLHTWATCYRWDLAGDPWAHTVTNGRPHGEAVDRRTALGEASAALASHLGITVDGYEVKA